MFGRAVAVHLRLVPVSRSARRGLLPGDRIIGLSGEIAQIVDQLPRCRALDCGKRIKPPAGRDEIVPRFPDQFNPELRKAHLTQGIILLLCPT